MFFAPTKSRQRAKIINVGVSKTTDHIQTKIKMPNPSQKPPASQRAKIWINIISKTSDHIKIKIKMPNPSQEPPASSKAPNKDLKDKDIPCTFKINLCR